MSRRWWQTTRERLSPFNSFSGSNAPPVTDEDFSYITSQDLETPNQNVPDLHASDLSVGRGGGPADAEDDILLVKNKGVTYPAHFPAYTIGDGKLRVKDVRDRVGVLMELSGERTRQIKLLYKGKQLKEPAAPVRDYGVKNKSELMAVLPEGQDDSSISDGVPGGAKTGKRKGRSGRKKGKGDGGATLEPEREPSRSPSVAGPMAKLESLGREFTTKWLPLCVQYTASPPSDPKKRDEEHRRLSESIMQHIMLKLDEVDTEGVAEVRAKRKELVRQVQDVLKGLDAAKAS